MKRLHDGFMMEIITWIFRELTNGFLVVTKIKKEKKKRIISF